MGYDLHITRAENWYDSGQIPITREEWLAYLAEDGELGRDEGNGADDFLYLAHLEGAVPIWWTDGRLVTKNPDEVMLKKCVEIAAALGARAQGDDGEFY